jgi:antitoxin component HigA of HigAB toxin-antitoxin module
MPSFAPIRRYSLNAFTTTSSSAAAPHPGASRTFTSGVIVRDLEAFIGPSGRVSEVLNRERPLSLRMIKRLHEGLKIPYESLLAEAT